MKTFPKTRAKFAELAEAPNKVGTVAIIALLIAVTALIVAIGGRNGN